MTLHTVCWMIIDWAIEAYVYLAAGVSHLDPCASYGLLKFAVLRAIIIFISIGKNQSDNQQCGKYSFSHVATKKRNSHMKYPE